MCTALAMKEKHRIFGRNLDVEYSYGEKIIICPRNFNYKSTESDQSKTNYAIIGIGCVKNNYPLFFDASNEQGLSMAGLKYSKAHYAKPASEKTNISTHELIPYILGKCQNIAEALQEIKSINICDCPFDKTMPAAPLHWLISDKEKSITLEVEKTGVKIYENTLEILTNMPDFKTQIYNLGNYRNISASPVKNSLMPSVDFKEYSNGLGAFGLPGDVSSMSRFVRTSFYKYNIKSDMNSENDDITAFFHILQNVGQIYGCTITSDSKKEFTLYSSCCDTDTLTYYYTTYTNSRINAVKMSEETANAEVLTCYPLRKAQDIYYEKQTNQLPLK